MHISIDGQRFAGASHIVRANVGRLWVPNRVGTRSHQRKPWKWFVRTESFPQPNIDPRLSTNATGLSGSITIRSVGTPKLSQILVRANRSGPSKRERECCRECPDRATEADRLRAPVSTIADSMCPESYPIAMVAMARRSVKGSVFHSCQIVETSLCTGLAFPLAMPCP